MKTTSKQLVAQQVKAFCANWKMVNLSYARSKNLTPYDVLTIASLIQGEAVVRLEATNDFHGEFRLYRLEQHLALEEVDGNVLESPTSQRMFGRLVDCKTELRMENPIQVVDAEDRRNVPGYRNLRRHKAYINCPSILAMCRVP